MIKILEKLVEMHGIKKHIFFLSIKFFTSLKKHGKNVV